MSGDYIDGDDSDAHYDLVMPFVVCASNGGPFDDHAYCAGFEAGRIDAKLAVFALLEQHTTDLLFVAGNEPQIELLLMKHNWNVQPDSRSEADGWVSIKVVGF